MKRCPECRRDYYDDSLLYCLDDGSLLLEGPFAFVSGSLEIFRDIGYVEGVASKLSNLAAVELLRDNLPEARKILRESLERMSEIGDITILGPIMDGFAALKVSEGDLDQAARFSGFARNLSESIGLPGEPAERRLRDFTLSKLEAMDKQDFSRCFAEGRKMSLEEAAALALTG